MATIAKVTNGASSASALNYALGKSKEMHEDTEKWLKDNDLQKQVGLENYRAVAIGGTNGIMPEIAKEQFKATQKMYGQDKRKNQVLRITQSFAPNELSALRPQDWQKANNLGCELAQNLYPDYQSAVYTHIDGKNHVLHNHIIVNKVNMTTGKKLSEYPKKTVARLRDFNDQLAKREQWHVLEPKRERLSDTEIDLNKKHEYSYMNDLRNRIDTTMSDTSISDFKSFSERLSEKGVIVNERGKNLSYSFLDANKKQKRARGVRLGTDYEKETIKNELENRTRQQNQQRIMGLGRETEQRKQVTTKLDTQATRTDSSLIESTKFRERIKNSIKQFTKGLQLFKQAVPVITGKITKRIKEKSLYKDVSQRFKSDMDKKAQEKRLEISRDLKFRDLLQKKIAKDLEEQAIQKQNQRILERHRGPEL